MLRTKVLCILSFFSVIELYHRPCHLFLSFICRQGLAELPRVHPHLPIFLHSLPSGWDSKSVPPTVQGAIMSLKECVCCRSNSRTESEIPASSLPSNSFHHPPPFSPHDQISTQSLCQGLLSSLSPLLKFLTFQGSLIDSEKDTS